MGTCFLYGNGGGSSSSNLDFYMKRYDTEEALLADSPKNHTIGVVTTLGISQWIMNASAGALDTTDGAVTIVYKASSTYDDSTLHTKFFDGKISGFSGQAWMELFACFQSDGVSYIPVTAYVYKNDTWVKFSSSFSASISVTYPAGSTCTATCGSRSITAPDTTGTWECVVPDAGSWVISCTDGTDTASSTVSISSSGESKSVTLSYRLPYFYYNGNSNVTLSGSSYNNSGGYISIRSTDDGSGDRKPTVSFAIPEIEKYKTIKCTINSFGGTNPTIKITNSSGTAIASVTVSSNKTYSIDLSSKSLSGNSYKFVLGTSSYYEQTDAYGNGYWVAGSVKTNHIWGE